MAGIAVFVDSRGGNARKAAGAIAEDLGIYGTVIKNTLPDPAARLFP